MSDSIDDLSFDDFDKYYYGSESTATTSTAPTTPSSYRYCDICNVAMECRNSELVCPQCGQIKEEYIDAEYEDENENKSTSVRIKCGSRIKTYNIGGDYSRTQKKNIYTQLINCLDAYTAAGGLAFPKNILTSVSEQYNTLQKIIDAETGKKFVRRGDIKDEILAALVWRECIRQGVGRKRKDVANMMQLSTRGFSRGDNILRDLKSRGYNVMSTQSATAESFIQRYAELINLECNTVVNDYGYISSRGALTPDYIKFVCEIVELSEDYNIGMNSYISSKVVGAIWIVVSHVPLAVPCATLERCCDNTKKNTFIKFYNAVMRALRVFAPLFHKYEIPLICQSP